MTANPPDRLDRIEAIVESTAIALRDMQVKQDWMQEQQDRTQQHLDQVGRFVADLSNDVAQVSANQEQQDVRMAQLTANVESLVSA